MADPLLGVQQYVAEWDVDTDELWLTGTTAGPAGSIELVLEGVVVTLDAADSAVVNSVSVDRARRASTDDAMRDLLDRLIGPDVVDDAFAVVGATAAIRTRIGGRDYGRRGGSGLSPVLARLATTSSAAGSAGLLPHERALAQLEAVALASRLQLDEQLPDLTTNLIDSAAMLVESADALVEAMDEDLRGGMDTRRMAADICDEAAGSITDRSLASDLAGVATRLRMTKIFDVWPRLRQHRADSALQRVERARPRSR